VRLAGPIVVVGPFLGGVFDAAMNEPVAG
jgi:hypothetical protein